MDNRRYFQNRALPACLLAPQLIITLIFFFWPAAEGVKEAFMRGDAFGLHSHFAGLANFWQLFHSSTYLHACMTTVIFSVAVTGLAMSSALVLATMANRVIHGNSVYRTFLIWPYAVAPAVAGICWRFLFNPSIGVLSVALHHLGLPWNYLLQGKQALLLVILASAWQLFSYNFVFFLAGLQSIPQSLVEAAAIDGAGPWQRFRSITLPLLSPTTFFLCVVNIIYACFETFGVIATVTQGGPANSTNILVYKLYNDAFMGLNMGASAAESVLLMAVVVVLTIIQFRYIERRVHY